MTKRQRDTRLTREQLEAGDYGDEVDDAESGKPAIAPQAELSTRKIVRVKRHVQSTGEVQSETLSKPTQFKLAGNLSASATSQTTSATKPSFSFAPAAPEQPKEEPKVEPKNESKPLFGATGSLTGTFGGKDVSQTTQKSAGSLFGGAPSKPVFGVNSGALFKPSSGGTFGGKPLAEAPKEEPKPAAPSGGLFGAKPATGGSLFGNLNTVAKPAEQADPAKKPSLFGTPATTTGDSTQKFGLFGATKPANGEEKKSLFGGAPATSGGLFGSAPPASGGLFGSKPPTGGSLFGSGATPATGGLFSNANAGSNLFGAKPADDNKNAESDDEEEEGEKSPPVYADSTNVEFKGAGAQMIKPSPYTKLFEKHVSTFKIVKPEHLVRKITTCEISIEFAETNGKKIYLVVVRCAKKVLFQGQLNAKVSRCRRVEEKSAKNQLKMAIQYMADVKVEKDGVKTSTKKVEFPYCVVNFSRQEEMSNFETEFNKATAALKAEQSK